MIEAVSELTHPELHQADTNSRSPSKRQLRLKLVKLHTDLRFRNRIYKLWCARNPGFEHTGRVVRQCTLYISGDPDMS